MIDLVIMAAGIGSRFGGAKQMTPVDDYGNYLIDYNIYDAYRCGVRKVVLIVKREHIDIMKETIGKRISRYMEVVYAIQDIDDVPVCVSVSREKPWGTGHALLAARKYVSNNFVIINADDYYGYDAFKNICDYLKNNNTYAMVGYKLINTISDNGTVSRGVCMVNQDGFLSDIHEYTKIGYIDGVLKDSVEDTLLEEDIPVSVNLFGFTPRVFGDGMEFFKEFLESEEDLSKKEFYLPVVVSKSLNDVGVKVLSTNSVYCGMTYREDLDKVREYLRNEVLRGNYKEGLWEE